MSRLLTLSSTDVAALLDVGELIYELPLAFTAVSDGRASVPPRTAAFAVAGLLGSMPGYVPGLGLAAKLVSVFAGNHARGLPSHQALIAVFDESAGAPIAVMDGTEITATRTAAASALSVRLLAPPQARTVAILGAGVQGRAHLATVAYVLPEAEFRIASRDPAHARALAATHPRATAAGSFADAVRDADVVCCCTDAPVPIIDHRWLAPGAHVTSVGCSAAGPEVDAATVAAASVFVEARTAVQPFPAGCHELVDLDPQTITELGEVISGTRPGRRSADELTLYKSMGHAVEDLTAAALVLRRARERGAGTTVEL